ncbi:YpuI family protein [Cytobacillus horneckiae]|uniref:YpuI family protein n=1 Tax=Cytobacillus horneckiae TaxID=549687 RepID=UPI0034CDED07
MANSIVETQMKDVQQFLSSAVVIFDDFLNETTLSALLEEKQGDKDYYKSILTNLRKLLVYCEEGHDACRIILMSDQFQRGAAEKTLYRLYHHCIEEFFAPRSDSWYENSRSAYTGKNSIRFHKEVPDSVSNLFKGLESDFQKIREELEYYETDYRTKMMQSK